MVLLLVVPLVLVLVLVVLVLLVLVLVLVVLLEPDRPRCQTYWATTSCMQEEKKCRAALPDTAANPSHRPQPLKSFGSL